MVRTAIQQADGATTTAALKEAVGDTKGAAIDQLQGT